MGKMCLFSEVNGVVLRNGKPVEGAVVEREAFWRWKQQRIRDSATTNEQGEFKLPMVERASILGSFLPHEPVIEQGILIHVGREEFEAWGFIKRNYRVNGEADGKPLHMVCELTGEPVRRGKVYGLCVLE